MIELGQVWECIKPMQAWLNNTCRVININAGDKIIIIDIENISTHPMDRVIKAKLCNPVIDIEFYGANLIDYKLI